MGILHCLQLDGRVAFSRVAAVLGVSEQTVARRYARLRGDGVVRVVGLIDPGRQAQTDWLLRIRARSDHVTGLADALAARDDVSWVSICSGGTEILASLSAPDSADRDDLLMRRLPRTARVLDLAASAVLHRFPGPAGHDFRLPTALVGQQDAAALLRARRPLAPDAPRLTASDQPLVAALAADGRASIAELARGSGWSETRTSARLRALTESGRVYVDVDVAHESVGYRSSAQLWLVVEPRALSAVGGALAGHPGVAFVGAVTGPANLVVAVVLTGPAALYGFVDAALGSLDGVRAVEVQPVLRFVKQAGTLVVNGRLRGL